MTYRLVLAPLARADISDVLEWSIEHFGAAVSDGYEVLIDTALRDIAANPTLPGSHDRSELGRDVRAIHLSMSRDHVPADARRILDPSHFVFYRLIGDVVHVSRVLHEARNFAEHSFP